MRARLSATLPLDTVVTVDTDGTLGMNAASHVRPRARTPVAGARSGGEVGFSSACTTGAVAFTAPIQKADTELLASAVDHILRGIAQRHANPHRGGPVLQGGEEACRLAAWPH